MSGGGVDLADLKRRMEGAISVLRTEFSTLRTGRASPVLLEKIMVPAYGTPTPLPQLSTVSVPDPRMLMVNVWDKSLAAAVDKAIREAPLGLNPVMDGQNLRVPVPALNEERRTELARQAGRYAENARIAVRNVRRDGMDAVRALEKEGEISRDQQKDREAEIQKLTDEHIARIDETLKGKEIEIMQV